MLAFCILVFLSSLLRETSYTIHGTRLLKIQVYCIILHVLQQRSSTTKSMATLKERTSGILLVLTRWTLLSIALGVVYVLNVYLNWFASDINFTTTKNNGCAQVESPHSRGSYRKASSRTPAYQNTSGYIQHNRRTITFSQGHRPLNRHSWSSSWNYQWMKLEETVRSQHIAEECTKFSIPWERL